MGAAKSDRRPWPRLLPIDNLRRPESKLPARCLYQAATSLQPLEALPDAMTDVLATVWGFRCMKQLQRGKSSRQPAQPSGQGDSNPVSAWKADPAETERRSR